MRVHPAPRTEFGSDEPRLSLVPSVGGVMLFSGDQLHATIPNTSGVTRYSIDFRTVHCRRARWDRGAVRGRSVCRHGASGLRRLTDLAGLSEDEVAPYDTEGADADG